MASSASTPTVRPADHHQAGVLADLAAATFPLACPPTVSEADIAEFLTTNLSAEAFAAYLRDPQATVLIAEDPGPGAQPIGFVLLLHTGPADPAIAAAVPFRPATEISKFYLLPGVHGSGAAAAMMDAALDAARERGAAGVWLGVNQENRRAQRFYAKAGFAVVGTKTFTVGTQTHDDFVLARKV